VVSRPCSTADDLGAGVEQHEVAGAVGVLGLAGREADLADGRRLLVAEDAGDRHLAAERPSPASCRRPSGRWTTTISGSISRGMPKNPSSSSSQSRVSQVHEHRARGVGHVGDVRPPSGPPVRFQTTQLSIVPKRASPRSAASRRPSTFSRIHWTLPAEKYGRRRQPGLAPDDVPARRVEGLGDRVGAGVLPDDRVVERPAGAPVPDDRRLALVGDPDARRGRRARSGRGEGRLDDVSVRSQISTGLCSTQPAAAGSARARAGAGRPRGPAWSKTMNRVLVVPWSTAPTKSAMLASLAVGTARGRGAVDNVREPRPRPLPRSTVMEERLVAISPGPGEVLVTCGGRRAAGGLGRSV
jgi:hypothetical protein